MLSIFAENGIGSIISTTSIIILFTIISTMDLPLLPVSIRFYLPAIPPRGRAFLTWLPILKPEPQSGVQYIVQVLVHAGFVLVLHIVGFFGVGLFAFKKKDILSQ